MCSCNSRKRVRFAQVEDAIIPSCRVLVGIEDDLLTMSSSSHGMAVDSSHNTTTTTSSWYTAQDMEHFRTESRMVASGIRNRFKADASNPTSYSNILIMIHTVCLRKQGPSQDIIHQLANWLEVGATRRGLEKLSVEAIHRDRRKRIRKSVEAVMATQDILKKIGNIDEDEKAEQIRLVYQEITLPSKLFALSLGVADAMAATQDRVSKMTRCVRTIPSAA